jgi:hypothetical protein
MTRTTPYKDVTRAKCVRCGGKASHQWTGVCAERGDKGKGAVLYHALCTPCDVKLNRLSLVFVYGAEIAKQMMRGYDGT